MIEWYVKGREFANCNCDYGCPCQFNALPTHGDCRASSAYIVDEGMFGEVSLAGTRAALIAQWPKAIHEGTGTMQLIVDEASSEAQRDAWLKILTGQDTEPMATMWAVFATTITNFLDPLVRPIDVAIDVDAREARKSTTPKNNSPTTPPRCAGAPRPPRRRPGQPSRCSRRVA